MKRFLLASFTAGLVANSMPFRFISILRLLLWAQTVLGDLTAMQTVVKDTQAIAEKGDLVAGGKRTTDFETLWDAEESRLRPMNKEAWSNVDSASDGVVKALRSKTPDAAKVKSALAALLAALSDPSKPVN